MNEQLVKEGLINIMWSTYLTFNDLSVYQLFLYYRRMRTFYSRVHNYLSNFLLYKGNNA